MAYNVKSPKIISASGAATRTLTALESGQTFLFDSASGVVYTLPTPTVGLSYDFYVSTTITSNAAKVITSAGTVFMSGTVITGLEATTPGATVGPKLFTGDPAASVSISCNGTTSGAIKGTKFKVTCVSSTLWVVEGVFLGSGIVITPFAAS